jgi:hypothetical protein
MSDLIKYGIIFGIIYYIYQNSQTAKQEVIIRRDDGWDWRSPPYLQNRYLPTVN